MPRRVRNLRSWSYEQTARRPRGWRNRKAESGALSILSLILRDFVEIVVGVTKIDGHDWSRCSCPAHRALLDQRWLDGLLFARYLSERLLIDEFCL